MNTEIDDLWRLYAREWVIAHTITRRGNDGRETFEACRQWFAENLQGRVRDGDFQVELNTDGDHLFWGHVMIYKDNLKGEFKNFHNAENHAELSGLEEYTIVARNSPEDHAIRSYGVKKL